MVVYVCVIFGIVIGGERYLESSRCCYLCVVMKVFDSEYGKRNTRRVLFRYVFFLVELLFLRYS